MVSFSILFLAAASLGSSVFAAPSLRDLELFSANKEVDKRVVCPLACPPDSVFVPPCRCEPDPPVEKRNPPLCGVVCEFGRAPGDGCECNPGPRPKKRNCTLFCPFGFDPSRSCTCLPDPDNEKRAQLCKIYCPFGYDPSVTCGCLPEPDNEKRARSVCQIFCPFGSDPSVICGCLPDPSIRCGNVCLPGTKHDPNAAGSCNCAPYHPCDLEARCVAGELFAWDDAAQTCMCLKQEDTCTEDVTCLTGFVWQYESNSRACQCLSP